MIYTNTFLAFVCNDRMNNPTTYGFANAAKTIEICHELLFDNYYGLDPEIKIELLDDHARLTQEHIDWLARVI